MFRFDFDAISKESHPCPALHPLRPIPPRCPPVRPRGLRPHLALHHLLPASLGLVQHCHLQIPVLRVIYGEPRRSGLVMTDTVV